MTRFRGSIEHKFSGESIGIRTPSGDRMLRSRLLRSYRSSRPAFGPSDRPRAGSDRPPQARRALEPTRVARPKLQHTPPGSRSGRPSRPLPRKASSHCRTARVEIPSGSQVAALSASAGRPDALKPVEEAAVGGLSGGLIGVPESAIGELVAERGRGTLARAESSLASTNRRASAAM
jgi:hypothetical protein